VLSPLPVRVKETCKDNLSFIYVCYSKVSRLFPDTETTLVTYTPQTTSLKDTKRTMSNNKNLGVIILAAGKGTRMKSQYAKVLHEVFFHPMIHHVVRAVQPLSPDQTIIIVGHQREAVQSALFEFQVDFARQEQQLGTGHAVLSAEPLLNKMTSTVMILCGDTPLVKPETLASMVEAHRNGRRDLTLMTTELADPTNYGRILKDNRGKVQGIVEQKDANPQQLAIKEINAGIYLVDAQFLFSALKKIGTDNSQGEMYLTDIVEIAVQDNKNVGTFSADDPVEILGVNSRIELARASEEMQQRRNRDIMASGVSLTLPATVTVAPEATIGRDSQLDSMVKISGTSIIGESCVIGQGSILHNVLAGDKVVIGPYSYVSNTKLESGTILPPFSNISGI